MNDQAAKLRKIINNQPPLTKPNRYDAKIITVTSGKGGVGKSNTVLNIAISLQKLGKKVVILDADFGLANIEVLLGIVPKYNLSHVLSGKMSILDIIEKNDDGIEFISGGSGIKDLMFLNSNQVELFANNISKLENYADFIIIDTSAGITETVLQFCKLANEIIFITTPEPTAITDAYALIKTLKNSYTQELPKLNILVNKSETEQEAKQVYTKLSSVCNHFLDIVINYIGYVPFDYNVIKAAKIQEPISKCYENSSASLAYLQIGKTILEIPDDKQKTKKSFFKQVLSMFSR